MELLCSGVPSAERAMLLHGIIVLGIVCTSVSLAWSYLVTTCSVGWVGLRRRVPEPRISECLTILLASARASWLTDACKVSCVPLTRRMPRLMMHDRSFLFQGLSFPLCLVGGGRLRLGLPHLCCLPSLGVDLMMSAFSHSGNATSASPWSGLVLLSKHFGLWRRLGQEEETGAADASVSGPRAKKGKGAESSTSPSSPDVEMMDAPDEQERVRELRELGGCSDDAAHVDSLGEEVGRTFEQGAASLGHPDRADRTPLRPPTGPRAEARAAGSPRRGAIQSPSTFARDQFFRWGLGRVTSVKE